MRDENEEWRLGGEGERERKRGRKREEQRISFFVLFLYII